MATFQQVLGQSIESGNAKVTLTIEDKEGSFQETFEFDGVKVSALANVFPSGVIAASLLLTPKA